MEFTIGRDEFFKSLQRAQGIVSPKGAMPILANVLIEAADSGIDVFATNLDMGFRGSYEAEVSSPGRVTAQARKLFDIVRELPPEPVSARLDDDGRLRITCGSSKFNLSTISADEFPAFPSYDESGFIALDSEMLLEMIRKTSYAISQDETRLTLNGASFEIDPTKARMVATDGHRLAFIEREGAFKVAEPVKTIIARKAVNELYRLLSEDGEPIDFLTQDNHAVFRKGSSVLVIRLIEGAFPNYEQVIPKAHTREAVIESSAFTHSLRRVNTLADEKSHMVRLSFGDGRLELSSEGGELGEARDEIPVKYTGEELLIGLNANYLLDMLSILNEDEVVLRMQDPLSPVLARAAGDAGLLCIVMPMRL
ncbi:MAG: DNA polymerase III subunit beta [Candidatus Nitrospinota bacterium M3_3B_026]